MRKSPKKKRTITRETGWFTLSEVARAFDVTDLMASRGYCSLAPAHACRLKTAGPGKGRSKEYHLRTVIEVWAEKKYGTEPDAGGSSVGEFKSPLEEEKWKRAKRINEVEAGKYVETAQVHEMLGRCAKHLQGAAAKIRKKHGPEAAGHIDAALDAFLREVEAAAGKAPEEGEGE